MCDSGLWAFISTVKLFFSDRHLDSDGHTTFITYIAIQIKIRKVLMLQSYIGIKISDEAWLE